MLPRNKLIISFIFLLGIIGLLLPTQLRATHLVGGSTAFVYLGKDNSGKFNYRITFTIYRDCLFGQADYDDDIQVGFYENDGIGNLYKTIKLIKPSIRRVNPPTGGSSCANIPNFCLEEGIYTGFVSLDASPFGYDYVFERCCRNTMVNVPDEIGQTYYGFISPTGIVNSSPRFTDIPAPYICLNDSVKLIYTAIDDDGDSLAYKLATPWDGADKSNPKPSPSLDFIYPRNVPYKGGFSTANPFGTSGLATIEPITGLLKLYSTIVGNFAIAVDVFEYRNGKLLAVTRRDIQIIVTSCNPNPVPQRQFVNGSKSNTYVITAGQKLEFDVEYADPNDNINLVVTGDIFDASKTNPPATMSNASGFTRLRSKFIWQTTCKNTKTQPYIFYLRVSDDGCPPKITNDAITVFVRPLKGPTKIFGPQPACLGSSQRYYVNTTSKTNKIIWTVSGGNFKNSFSNTDTSIDVIWIAKGSGRISAYETTTEGCVSDTTFLIIPIFSRPTISKIVGPINVCFGKQSTYSINQNPDVANYLWFVNKAQIIGNANSNIITVQWNNRGTDIVKVVGVASTGCPSDTQYLNIRISEPLAKKIFGSNSVCPNASNISYFVTGQLNSKYIWTINGGTQVSGGNTASIKVNWGNKGSGLVKVYEVTEFGCLGDTLLMPIIIDYVLYTPPVIGDTSLCEFTKGVIYSVPSTNNSNYKWAISGGTIISGQNSNSIIVDWDSEQIGYIGVQEFAFDSVNGTQCIGRPIGKPINIHPIPRTTGITGPDKICENDTGIYSVTGFAGSRFTWVVNGKLLPDTTPTIKYVFRLSSSNKDTLIFQVVELSKDSCPGTVRTYGVRVFRLPITGNIIGPKSVCFPNLTNIQYYVKGFKTSTYLWSTDGGIITSGQGTDTISIDFNRAGIRKVNVQEVNDFGCPGPKRTFDIIVDSLDVRLVYVSTLPENDKVIKVKFKPINSQFHTSRWLIYRRADKSDIEYLIDSVSYEKTEYIDRNVETGLHSYYYRVVGRNSCRFEMSTNIHRSILLKGNIKDTSIFTTWNEYEGWLRGVAAYRFNRLYNEDTTLNLFSESLDLRQSLVASLEGYKQCFRVIAIENNGGDTSRSYSNKICFDFEPILWIPNSFTPGNGEAGLNDYFKVIASNYKSFSITIFNRWGEKLFTSNDLMKQWDGTYKGKQCPMDVYVYQVSLGGGRSNIFKNGTINLLR